MSGVTRHSGAIYGHSKNRRPGSKQFYRPIYSASKWDDFLAERILGGLSLQVCAGGSSVCDVRLDIDPTAHGANVMGDMLLLPFRNKSFDTVACDPLYELDLPNRVHLQRELARVARKRIVFKAPWISRATYFKLTETVLLASHTCVNVAILSVLDFDNAVSAAEANAKADEYLAASLERAGRVRPTGSRQTELPFCQAEVTG